MTGQYLMEDLTGQATKEVSPLLNLDEIPLKSMRERFQTSSLRKVS